MTKGKDGKSRWNWRVDESKGERGEREGEDSRIEQAREREAPGGELKRRMLETTPETNSTA